MKLEGEPTGSQETEPEKCVQRAPSEQCVGGSGGQRAGNTEVRQRYGPTFWTNRASQGLS